MKHFCIPEKVCMYYLSKSTAFSCRFVKVCMTFKETLGTKGLTAIVLEFENDPVLAAVLAQSQQEYLDSLSRGHTDSKCEYPPTSQEN